MRRRSLMIGVTAVGLALLGTTAALGHVHDPSVNRHAQLPANNRSAVISGTIRCDTGERLFVSAFLTQTKGRTSVLGFGGSEQMNCTGVSQGFSITVPAADEGTFKPGPAAARVSAFSCQQEFNEDFNDFVCTEHTDNGVVNTTVHLRR